MSSSEGGGSQRMGGGSSVQIDRLLDVVVKEDASDLHVTVGRPPTVRLNGRLRNMQTKVLDADDCMALMKSITPEKNQAEFQERGGTDFGFSFSEAAGTLSGSITSGTNDAQEADGTGLDLSAWAYVWLGRDGRERVGNGADIKNIGVNARIGADWHGSQIGRAHV